MATTADPGPTATAPTGDQDHIPTTAALYAEGDFTIKVPCGFPAPLALNGAAFVGCQLDKGHEGLHKVEITWGTP